MATEEVFTAREVASVLGLAGAMLRRYAATYEELTNSSIEVHRREGRLFTKAQLDVLLQARDLVSTQGLSVRAAMKIAVAKDDSSSLGEHALTHAESRFKAGAGEAVGKDALALKEMFTEALKSAVTDANKPLLEEIRGLRADLAIKSDLRLHSEQEKSGDKGPKYGLLVRFAIWVEGLLRR